LAWGRSNFDRLHSYTLSTIYDLPMGPGKALDDRQCGRQGDWRLADQRPVHRPIGHAVEHHGNGTLLNTPGNTAYANANGEQKVLGGLGPGLLYFDPTVYSLPAANVQGNMKRNGGPEGPGFWEIDAALFKRFGIGASRYAEFRVDAFNVTNSVRWGNPNTAYATGTGNTFGQITGVATGSGPRTLRSEAGSPSDARGDLGTWGLETVP
jgi:hypothetical protein